MTAASTIDDRTQFQTRETGRRSDPLRSGLDRLRSSQRPPLGSQIVRSAERVVLARPTIVGRAAKRRSDQFPAFAPLLEELEIAGWSSLHRLLSGNFHDWLLLGEGRMLVTVGQAVGPEPRDPMEAALVSQAAWSAVRAHAHHTRDAGTLLSLAARTLWPMPGAAWQAAVAVALVDTTGGRASVAMAGDCLVWRVRAASCEQVLIRQPMLAGAADFTYASHSLQLSLRERLLMVADDPSRRLPKLGSSIGAELSRLDAESHRRMTATGAVALLRRHYQPETDDDTGVPVSIAAVRRR